jgi:internalin A
MDSETATRNQAGEPPPTPARKRARGLSVRVLMVLVLVVAIMLGWIAHRARLQREVVAAIEAAGGSVAYDLPFGLNRGALSRFSYLEHIIGPDYFENVTRVYLGSPGTGSFYHVNDALMSQIARLTKLERLEIHSADVSDAGLAPIRRLHKLRHLDLTAPQITHLGPTNFGGFNKLEFLSLRCDRIQRLDLTFLQDLTSLKRFTLYRLGQEHDLRSLEHLKQLEILDLYDPVDDDDLTHIAALTSLEQLTINGRHVTNSGFEHVRPLRRLKSLSISMGRITSMEPLGGMGSLQLLTLFRTQIDDAGIAAVKTLPSLKRLHLEEASLTDAGLVHLSGLSRLTVLDLSGNEITDAGLMQLAGLTSCTQLRVKNTQVTPAGVAALQAKCPLMRIAR